MRSRSFRDFTRQLKVYGTHSCGEKMPIIPRTIDAGGIACLREWVYRVAGQ